MTTIENLQLSGGARLSKEPCRDCGKYFVYYPQDLPSGEAPKRCPRCKDVYQGRPSVVEERKELAHYEAVEVKSLPGKWDEISSGHPGDSPKYRIVVKGLEFGAEWSGRIDMFASRPISPEEVVHIRDMEATHRVRVKTAVVAHIQKSPYDPPTHLEDRVLPVTSNEGEETLMTRRYLVLEPAAPGTEPKSRLVWATAYTKTTIKGFGRQFWSKITGTPIAEWRISGGFRSGRAHTDGVLAIVDADHPIVATTTGDYRGEKVYS